MTPTVTQLVEQHRAEKGCDCEPAITFGARFDKAVVLIQHDNRCPAWRGDPWWHTSAWQAVTT